MTIRGETVIAMSQMRLVLDAATYCSTALAKPETPLRRSPHFLRRQLTEMVIEVSSIPASWLVGLPSPRGGWEREGRGSGWGARGRGEGGATL